MQLEKFYPNVDIAMIYKLYGLNVDPKFKSMWDYKGSRLNFICKQLLKDQQQLKKMRGFSTATLKFYCHLKLAVELKNHFYCYCKIAKFPLHSPSQHI